MEPEDIIQIKFDGRGVFPEDFRLSELARLFKLIEDYFTRQIKSTEPEIPREDLRISLNSIKRGSADYGLLSSMPDVTLSAFYKFGDAVTKNDYTGLVPEGRYLAKTIVSFTRRHQCVALLNSNHGRGYSVTLTPETKIGGLRTIRGETQFYGALERIGGVEPGFALRISEHEVLRGDIDEELAKELAKRLYSWVGLTGVAQWDPMTGEVEEFTATEILTYRGTGITKAVDLLRSAIGEYWDDEDDVEEAVYRLRSGEPP